MFLKDLLFNVLFVVAIIIGVITVLVGLFAIVALLLVFIPLCLLGDALSSLFRLMKEKCF